MSGPQGSGARLNPSGAGYEAAPGQAFTQHSSYNSSSNQPSYGRPDAGPGIDSSLASHIPGGQGVSTATEQGFGRVGGSGTGIDQSLGSHVPHGQNVASAGGQGFGRVAPPSGGQQGYMSSGGIPPSFDTGSGGQSGGHSYGGQSFGGQSGAQSFGGQSGDQGFGGQSGGQGAGAKYNAGQALANQGVADQAAFVGSKTVGHHNIPHYDKEDPKLPSAGAMSGSSGAQQGVGGASGRGDNLPSQDQGDLSRKEWVAPALSPLTGGADNTGGTGAGLKQTLNNAVEATKEYLPAQLGGHAGTGQHTANKAGEQARDLGNKAGQQAQHTANKAGEQARDLGNKAGQQAQRAGDQAGQTARRAQDQAGQAAQNVRAQAGQAVQGLQQQAHQVLDAAQPYIEQAKHVASEYTSVAADKARELASIAQAQGGDTLRQAQDKLSDAAAQGQYKAQQLAHDIQHGGTEDINRNPILRALGAIFITWLTFGYSVWVAFYASLVAAIAGGLALFTGRGSNARQPGMAGRVNMPSMPSSGQGHGGQSGGQSSYSEQMKGGQSGYASGQTGQGYGTTAAGQGYTGGAGYTGTDSNRPTGQGYGGSDNRSGQGQGQGYSGTDANRGGPQTDQSGYDQNTTVAGGGMGQYGAGPTGANRGGPQTDQSSGPLGQGANRF